MLRGMALAPLSGSDEYPRPLEWYSVIQYLFHDEPIYRDLDGNSFFPDKKGDELRDIHEGAFIRANGTDNFVDYDSVTCSSSDVVEIYIKDFKYINRTQNLPLITSSSFGTGDYQVTFGVNDLNQIIASRDSNSGLDLVVACDDVTEFHDYSYIQTGSTVSVYQDNVLKGSFATGGFGATTAAFLLFNLRSNYIGGLLGSITVKKNGITALHHNSEDAPAGSTFATVYDSSGIGLVPNANHGTLNGTIDGNTRQRSIDVPSDQNLIGYTESGAEFIQALNTPENLALPLPQQIDVNGDPLGNPGRAKLPLQITDANITVSDGTHFIQSVDFSGLSIASFGGTATPSLVTDTISWTAGTMFYIELSNGIFIPFSCGSGVDVFDTKLGTQYLISGPTASLFDKSNTVEKFNQLNGFDKWELDASPGTFKQVIFKQNGTSILTDGDTLLGYTWVSRHVGSELYPIGAENTFTQPPAPEIRKAEEDYFDTRIFYDASGNPILIPYSAIVEDYENKGILTTDVTSKTPWYLNWVLRKTPFQVPWIDTEAWVDTEIYND